MSIGWYMHRNFWPKNKSALPMLAMKVVFITLATSINYLKNLPEKVRHNTEKS